MHDCPPSSRAGFNSPYALKTCPSRLNRVAIMPADVK